MNGSRWRTATVLVAAAAATISTAGCRQATQATKAARRSSGPVDAALTASSSQQTDQGPGTIFAFGGAGSFGSPAGQTLHAPPRTIARTPSGQGYWVTATDGGVFAYGDAGFHGSTGDIHLNQPIVGMAATPTGNGYWLVASDGGIFAFGDASFLGSTGNIKLNQPIVGMAATSAGRGYWLVASDGGIFAFGDAAFDGSTGNIHLNQPVVGMAATPTGNGYWLVASDGGIFAFGDAAFEGSTGGMHLNRPVVAMASTATGNGYWLVAADGGVFSFGDATFYGSAASSAPAQPIVAVATTPAGDGYWMLEGNRSLAGKVITIDPGHNGANGSHPAEINRQVNIVNGTKACDTTGTSTDDGYPESAYTFDVATRVAALLRAQGATVVLTRPDNDGVGPCIDERAGIGNRAGSAAAVSIHADGGPASGRGFHVIRPAPVGPNNGIIAASDRLGLILRDDFAAGTGTSFANYIGTDGLDRRSDLGGLNLSTVPKVFIETGNMRNASDAALLEDPVWRQRAAAAIAKAITDFVTS